MPKVVSSELRPNFVRKPDMRFATTFLSSTYRDYAVNGEAIMDKYTGELFMKRPDDGRVLSFNQNKKYVHDLMLELRVLLTNNEEFRYPKENESAYYLSTDYDLVAINKEKSNNIKECDTIIESNSDEKLYTIKFNVSKDSNGFFCRPMTRDTDKLIVEYYTNVYNTFFESYKGEDEVLLSEKEKFNLDMTWKDSNIILHYRLELSDGEKTVLITDTENIRFNESICVLFPYTTVYEEFPEGYKTAKVTIDSLEYYKMHYVLSHKELFDDDIDSAYRRFGCTDNNIYVNYLNIMSFVDNHMDIDLLGNEFLVAFMDIPYVKRYMSKLAKLKNSSDFITSMQRPDDTEWTANTVWAERIRDVCENGVIINRPHEVNIKSLEIFLARKIPIERVKISDKIFEDENFFLDDLSKDEYTKEEFDALINSLHAHMNSKIDDITKLVSSVESEYISESSTTLYGDIEKIEE